MRVRGRTRQRMQAGLLERACKPPADVPVDAARRDVGLRGGGAAGDDDRRSGVHGRWCPSAVRDRNADPAAEDSRKQQPKNHAERHVNRVGFRCRVPSLVWGISGTATVAGWPEVAGSRAPRRI